MKCPKCYIENPEDNKFCRGCGTALLSGCSKCGQKVIEAAKDDETQLSIVGYPADFLIL